MSGALRECRREELAPLPDEAGDWLRALGAPTSIRVPGRDRSRTRVVTTLLHGNEPSGFRAVHAWLRRGATPAVDALLVCANVEAALAPPGFARRMLPGRRDLNRCFHGPFDDPEGALAAAILDAIRDARPEAVLDLHNNTGHNPPYGVALDTGLPTLQLVSLFSDRIVHTGLRIGSLMEVVRACPCATIEVGRSGDPAADAVALSGLERFLESDVVLGDAEPLVHVLDMPMRAELRPGVKLAIDEAPVAACDLTLYADLDRHNFERVAAGTAIGWCASSDCPLTLRDEDGADRSAEYFAVDAGELRTLRPLVPIMITTDAAIAASDCLFYVVRERRPA